MTTTDRADGCDPPLEQGLPPDIEVALREFVEGVRDHSSLLDCLWGELYGAINANQWAGVITPEHADMLRRKYLFNYGGDDGSDRFQRLREERLQSLRRCQRQQDQHNLRGTRLHAEVPAQTRAHLGPELRQLLHDRVHRLPRLRIHGHSRPGDPAGSVHRQARQQEERRRLQGLRGGEQDPGGTATTPTWRPSSGPSTSSA